MAPKKRLSKSSPKPVKGESSRTPIAEPVSPISSPLHTSDIPRIWFENHTAYGRWADLFRQKSLSYVDILDYNFFLFEDFEIISSFIQSTPGKLLNPGSKTYPCLVKFFYSNLSTRFENGEQILRSFIKGQEILISKTLMNDIFEFSHKTDDQTPNIIALQDAKDMFLLESCADFSSTKQLTHNALNLNGKLLHYILVRTVFSRNSSCELVTDSHLILMWKIASMKNIDFSSIIFSTMRFCCSQTRNCALPFANLLTLIFDHFNLLSDEEEVDCSGPISLSSEILPSLGIFKVNHKYELYSNLSTADKEDLQKIHGKRLTRLEPHIQTHTTLSRLQSLDLEVGEIKSSLLILDDKVSILTSMLDTFMKEMKGMVVEDVVVEEEVPDDAAAMPTKEEVMEDAGEQREEERQNDEKPCDPQDVGVVDEEVQPVLMNDDDKVTTGKSAPSKKRKRRSRK